MGPGSRPPQQPPKGPTARGRGGPQPNAQRAAAPKPGPTAKGRGGRPAPAAAKAALYDPKFAAAAKPKAGQQCRMRVENKPCCVTGLTMKCGHGKRGFVLTPPTTKIPGRKDQVIQLLADHSNQDSLTLTLKGGPCKRGKAPLLPAIALAGNQIAGSRTLKLNAPTLPPMTKMRLDDFMNLCVMNNRAKNVSSYGGNVRCCQGGQEFNFLVEVFAYRKWAGSFSITQELGVATEIVNYNDYRTDPPTPRRAKLYSVDDAGTIKFTGNIEVTFGAKSYKVELPTFEKGRTAGRQSSVFNSTKRFVERVMPRLRNLCASPLVTIKPLWPNIALSGEMDMAEVEGKYNVGYQGKVSFKADPLIGLSGTFDLLGWLLMIGGAACGVPLPVLNKLAELREMAEGGVGNRYVGGKAVARIDCTASGKIGGGLEWAYSSAGKHSGKGSIGGDLDFEVKGEVSIEVRVLVVSYTAGISVTAKTGVAGEISATVGEGAGFKGTLKFKGLTIEAVTLSSVGGSTVGTKPTPAAEKAMRERQMAGRRDYGTSKTGGSTVRWKIEVIPEAEWTPWGGS